MGVGVGVGRAVVGGGGATSVPRTRFQSMSTIELSDPRPH